MSTNINEISKYLNNVKIRVNLDIDLINKQSESINDRITKLKIDFESSTQKIQETLLKINESNPKIKSYQDSLESDDKILDDMIKNEMLKEEITFQDNKVDLLGDRKTLLEKLKLDYSNYKLKCNELIEAIDMFLDDPDDVENQKQEIQDMINALYKQFTSLNLLIESNLKDLVNEK